MIFTNFNTLTVSFFLIFLMLSVFLVFKYIKKLNKNVLLSDKIKNNKRMGLYFLIGSFFFVVINIFGIKGKIIEGENLPGANILFLLDVSKSMNVEDTSYSSKKISRLELSKGFILDYVSKNPHNNYGLSIFAGETLRILPFTNDISIFKTFLTGVDENNLTKFGSEYKNAIEDSLSIFNQSEEKGLIILLTDISDEVTEFEINNYNNIPFFIVGVGTEEGGNIPIGKDFVGNVRYKIYKGKRVLSAININSLNMLSEILESENFILNKYNDYGKLNSFINEKSNSILTKGNLENRFDYISIFLIISLLLFIFSIFYSGRKK